MRQTAEEGIRLIAEALNDILRPEMHTTVLLETMAGKGSEVGRTFQELRAILDRVEFSDKMGVCLDTCHVYDAGYDIVNDLEGVLREFDRCIGIEKLKALHLNDSKNPMGSHKDRGYIFHNAGDQHTEAIQEQQIILKRFQQENDDYPAHSVNGADRPVQKAAVDESLGGDGTIYAFAEPSQKAVNKEQQKQ